MVDLRENSSNRMALLRTLNDWKYMLLAREREKAEVFEQSLTFQI
jgi:predicted glycosyltransferase